MTDVLTRALLYLVIAGVFASPPRHVLAYEANVGDRAANFRAFDIISRQPIELDDYLGKWVFIEFWATWCGPCMDELPNMLRQLKPYVDNGVLQVITINADTDETLPDLRRAIRDYRLTYPVVYDGGVYDQDGGDHPIPATEWGVTAFPFSYLVNPQGVIVANNLRGDTLGHTLDFYINNRYPLLGLRGLQKQNEDGSISVIADVLNCERDEVEVSLYTFQIRYFWGEDGVVYDEEIIYANEPVDSALVRFDEFSESIHEFILPADENRYVIKSYLYMSVPGSEEAGRGDRSGIEFIYVCDSTLLFHTDIVDGEYVVRR